MALVIQRASLISHLKVIAITPFAFFIGAIYVKRLTIAVLLVVVLALVMFGIIPLTIPLWQDVRENVLLMSCIVCALFVLGTVLTIADHLRFRGWSDDGPESAGQIAEQFACAVFTKNADLNKHLNVSNQLSRDFEEFLSKLQCELGDASVVISAKALRTTDHVLFRLLLPTLFSLECPIPKSVVFVPMVSNTNIPVGSQMRLLQIHFDGLEQIVFANVVSVRRPELLN